MSEELKEPSHIVELRAENFKILKAVKFRPNAVGVTKLVGKNGAGKTSIIDAIAATLGGKDHSPSAPIRKGEKKAKTVLELEKIIVTRTWSGDRTTLEVKNKEGQLFSSPQAVLDQLYGEIAFDPLGFARKTPIEQARQLARLSGFDMLKWAEEKAALFTRRTDVNKRHKSALAVLQTIPEVEAPKEPVSTAELADELATAETANRAADEARATAEEAKRKAVVNFDRVHALQRVVDDARIALVRAEKELAEGKELYAKIEEKMNTAKAEADKVVRVDTAPILEKMKQAGEINKKVAAKKERAAKVDAAYELEKESDKLTEELRAKTEELPHALAKVKLGVDGLTVDEDGEALYNGIPLKDASSAEQLRIGVAIAFAQNPKLRLCHIQDGSLLDADSMKAIDELANAKGFQVIIERVAAPGEVGVLIEDGEIVEAAEAAA